MPFGIIGRTGPGMRQVVRFGIGPREGVLLGANLGRAILTNVDFTAYVCDSASTSELRFGVLRAVGRCIAVLDGGPRRARGRGGFFGGIVPHFHNGKCDWVADGEMFPILLRKLDNFSIRQTYRCEALFVGFFGDILSFKINIGVYKKLAKK